MPAYTLLSIDAIDFSQWAVRGITMTLEPIEQATSLARDCRGILADISLAQFRQYKVTISCQDHEAPQLTGIWPGQDVTIVCIPGLGVPDSTTGQMTLPCKVTAWNTSREEWNAETAWELEAEQRAFS